MFDENDGAVLEVLLGTKNPLWRLPGDSNALELSAQRGVANLSVALTGEQARAIRELTGVTSHRVIEVSLRGQPVTLHLVGKKVDSRDWAGTACEYSDTLSVAGALSNGLAAAEQVVSEVNSLVVILDRNGIVQRFNRMCEEVTGLREVDVIGKSAFELFMTPDQGSQSRTNIKQFFERQQSFEVERVINTIKGPRLFQFRNKFVHSGSGIDETFIICSGTDITDERDAQRRLKELASKDVLTGLMNRYAINARIEWALEDVRHDPSRVLGIVFLDLDNFKRVNDHYGHVNGDRLIKRVSELVTECLDDGMTLARLGGDEFLILVDSCTQESLETLAQKIIDHLRVPMHLELIDVYTSCSIGIALYPQHGKTLEALISHADTAMYAAKEAGKQTYRVFSPEMNQKVAKYIWLDTELRKAIEEKQFVLHYQPLINLCTGRLHSVEALLRWQSTSRGLVPPSEFIRFTEESGLIIPIGRWLMREAAWQAARWHEAGLDIRVSVNVSARQLRDTEIVNQLRDLVEQDSAARTLIDIELTESCFIEDERAAIDLMRQFKQLGARILLDDFGTGYSSLSQLTRLPIDVIKLDRSFITGIDQNFQAQSLVRSVLGLARAFGFAIVAEGVETEREAQFLRDIGVDYAQGFFYAKPMPAEALEAWLLDKKKLRLIA
ncbi:cyclic di-GMP phosphodiesterase [Trinickia dabaoshanensis]|uniref:Cyclic di-GMP phosphodiesterase n=1 Tax=Trinickia dabaoshanensis TaxID=564714 RepID=A0A2N7VNB0_9BURK|nr:cyclic di-GMP phosphodiesterase [Trinickia dabaoshanensis]PMS18597.1 cyclic di-GMP phosphodiesterase [Trinickia dabaoshanensis]